MWAVFNKKGKLKAIVDTTKEAKELAEKIGGYYISAKIFRPC